MITKTTGTSPLSLNSARLAPPPPPPAPLEAPPAAGTGPLDAHAAHAAGSRSDLTLEAEEAATSIAGIEDDEELFASDRSRSSGGGGDGNV